MHIFLAVGSILRSQMELLVRGLESLVEPMSIDDWHTYRLHINEYFRKFADLMECLCENYLLRLLGDYGTGPVVDRLGGHVDSTVELCRDMVAFRSRIEKLRTSTLAVSTQKGTPVIPKYFDWCVFDEAQWQRTESHVQLLLTRVQKLTAEQKGKEKQTTTTD